LAYQGGDNGAMLFESPNNLSTPSTYIVAATATKIKNFQSGFEVATFDAMEDDRFLKDLVVESDYKVISSLDFPLIVIFENAEGKKGAIKLKSIDHEKLIVDIKVQKY